MFGPALWCGSLNHRLQYWYLICVPVQVLDIPFLVQLPVNVPGKTVENGPSSWVPAINMGILSETQAPAFRLSLALTIGAIWGVKRLKIHSLSLAWILSSHLSLKICLSKKIWNVFIKFLFKSGEIIIVLWQHACSFNTPLKLGFQYPSIRPMCKGTCCVQK